MKVKSARWHTIYSIISTLIEEAGIAALSLWVLPIFGIVIPLWGVILVLMGFAIFSYFMYRIGHPTILYKEISSPDAIIGCTGVAASAIDPEGYVRVCGELWKARCSYATLEKGEKIVVTAIDGLKLTVARKTPHGSD